MNSVEIQSKSGQDMVRTGDKWIVVCDGHGIGKVIDFLRALDWDHIVLDDNPIEFLNDAVRTLGNTAGDGATFSMVRITDDGIDCMWLGDSQIRVYADGTELWRSRNHNQESDEEIERHVNQGGELIETFTVKVLDEDTITMEPSYYFEVDKREKLAMTRALGHNDSYMPQVDRHFISFSDLPQPSGWKIVVATDGLWDMICEADKLLLASPEATAVKLGDLADSRWKQEWNYKHPPPHTTVSLGERLSSNQDDVGIAVWHN